MNGRSLPSDSKEMNAIITYYQWISKGLTIYADIPWLGLKYIESTHQPIPAKGKQVYGQKCAACHGSDGRGTQIGPPLWGKDSFNDGASTLSEWRSGAMSRRVSKAVMVDDMLRLPPR